MRLLFATLPRIQRLLPTTDTIVTGLFLTVLVGLELFGSFAASDLYDLLAGMVLALAVALLIDRHRRSPILWLSWLGSRFRTLGLRVKKLGFQLGIDLRGSPTLPARIPPLVWGVGCVLLGLIVASIAVWSLLPGGWRYLGVHSVYTFYLAGIMSVWVGTLVVTFVALYIIVQLIEGFLPAQWHHRDRRALQGVILVACGMTMASLAMWLPIIVVLGVTATLTLIGLIITLRTGRSEPALLWRQGSGEPIFSIPMWQATTGFYLILTLALAALLSAGSGGRLITHPELSDPMIITQILGFFACWMSPWLAGGMLVLVWVQWRDDPARPRSLSLVLTSHPESSYVENLNQAVKLLKGWGWEVVVSNHPKPTGFGMHLVPNELSEAKEFEPRWPLKVSLEDLHDGEVKDRFIRRDEIQLRRQVMRGVSTLFKQAFAERRSRGGGYWFAPQWAFYSALHRDPPDGASKDEAGPAGASYNSVFGPRARHYLYQMLRAMQVDSIYVEDGVTPRTLVRILRRMCELYDRHGGKRRAEDHLFRDTKVRVIIHDYAPGQRFEVSGYREPKFDELDRARVMHIFRDNGGEEAVIEDPFDFSWEPSPSLYI
jgi:hypothetical protein